MSQLGEKILHGCDRCTADRSAPHQKKSTLKLLREIHLQSIYRELCILVCTILTLPGTMAESECVFRKMKLVKKYMDSTMSQKRLNGLAVLAIERKLVQRPDLKDICRSFTAREVKRFKFGPKH